MALWERGGKDLRGKKDRYGFFQKNKSTFAI